jgi:hypothetical protein
VKEFGERRLSEGLAGARFVAVIGGRCLHFEALPS